MNKELAFAPWSAPRATSHALSANAVHDVGALSFHRHMPGPQLPGLSFVVTIRVTRYLL
jgi:hypothetical protein